MKGLAAVARREFSEHRLVLGAALASGVLAAVVPFFQSRGGTTAREMREVGASFVSISFAAGLALALGFSMIAGPLASRRLGFYFARPLSAGQVWGGKFAGGALLVISAGIAGAAPGLLLAGARTSVETRILLAASLCFCVVVLLPLAHALGIAVRSRSRWLALDFASLALALLLATVAARLLIRHLAIGALNRGLATFAVAVVVGLVAAGFASVSLGRTDGERSHRALSLVLWSVVGSAAALFLGYALWTISPRITQLLRVDGAIPAPRTSWIYTAGHTRGRDDLDAEFLFDTATRRAVRIRNRSAVPLFSRDGRVAVWCEPRYAARGLSLFSRPWGAIQGEGCEVLRLDLTNPGSAPDSARISFTGVPWSLALSPDGARLAVAGSEQGGRAVSVYELSSGRMLGAAPLPPKNHVSLVFAGPDRLRVYVDAGTYHRESTLQALEFDWNLRRIGETGVTPPVSEFRLLRVSPDGSRLLLVSGKRIVLADAVRLTELALLSSGPRWSRNAVFLDDGRIALAEGDPAGTRVRVFSPDGAEQKTITIGAPGRLSLGVEVRPGAIVVARRAERDSVDNSESLIVDLDSGALRSLGGHLTPAATTMWWMSDPSARLAAGDPGATLFIDQLTGALVRVNPQTAERRVLLPGS